MVFDEVIVQNFYYITPFRPFLVGQKGPKFDFSRLLVFVLVSYYFLVEITNFRVILENFHFWTPFSAPFSALFIGQNGLKLTFMRILVFVLVSNKFMREIMKFWVI